MELDFTNNLELEGREMPFFPPDKYVTLQNPPDFSWPFVPNASGYDLAVFRDAAMADMAYHAGNIPVNCYNFSVVFDVDTYYWSVRCRRGKEAGAWSGARRFRIAPKAAAFPVPPLAELLGRLPTGHPRIWTTPGTVGTLRDCSAGSFKKEYYDHIIHKAKGYLGQPLPPQPDYVPTGDYVRDSNRRLELASEANRMIDRMWVGAFAYLLCGDGRIGQSAAEALEALCGWDPLGATSYETQDQAHRAIAYRTAMAYDWLYDILSEGQRAAAEGMVRMRTLTMTEHLLRQKPLLEMPFESHGWTAYGYIGIIALAMYDAIPEAKDWLRAILPAYINLLPPWSREDGGWSQGTDYWQYSALSNFEFIDVLKYARIIDLDRKAYIRAGVKFPVYMFPKGSVGAFGDQSYRPPRSRYSGYVLARMAAVEKNAAAKWAMEQVGAPDMDILSGYLHADYASVEGREPLSWPGAMLFGDIHWACMHSDLIDPDRISLFFKSSPYGSFNHSHPDQNSFILQAYGQPLAIDSGYYDSYHSAFDCGYTRKTYAHNAITVDGGQGQADDSFLAKGEITAFLHGAQLDLVSGDATRAYMGLLKKAARHIVYIRPDLFVVIDDLHAGSQDGSVFEWWLNAQEDIKLYKGAAGARAQMGGAVLDAKVHHPLMAACRCSDRFSGPDLVHIPPAGRYENSPVQKRVWFETPKTRRASIIVTLDVHRSGRGARRIRTQTFAHYVKMRFEDGTAMLVKTADVPRVEAEDIAFSGTGVVYKDRAVMLIAGTSLVRGGETLVESAGECSVSISEGALGISTRGDNTVTVWAPGVSAVTDREKNALGKKAGITAANDGERIVFDAQKGDYSLLLFQGRPLY